MQLNKREAQLCANLLHIRAAQVLKSVASDRAKPATLARFKSHIDADEAYSQELHALAEKLEAFIESLK